MKIKEIIATIPINNTERAIHFYKDILNLEVQALSVDLGMHWVKIDNAKFLLYKRESKTKAEHTVISFTVENIAKSINELESKGVEFYNDNNAKIFNLDGSLSAWFQDTEGNNLEISQRPK